MKLEELSLLEKVFFIITEYLKNSQKSTPIRKSLTPVELRDNFNTVLRNFPIESEELVAILKRTLNYSLNTSHPLFMNQLYGGTNLVAILGDFFTTLLNTSMYTYEVAPLFTLIEQACLEKLGNFIGFSENTFDGTFTSGGSTSNMLAMLLAKDKKFPNSKFKGLKETPLFSIFISEQAHYSFFKNALLLGFGKESIIKIKSDTVGKIDLNNLLAEIEVEKAKGRIPLMLVGTAGTTINGVFDDLEKLSEIAKINDMWFHTDASYGGSLLFSNRYKNLLKGIKHSDSVAWNLHKMMGIPLTCASLIVKEKGLLEKSLSVEVDYLFHENSNEFDLGNKSLQCGRRVDAFKLWLAWSFEGNTGFETRVDTLINKALLFSEKLKANINFEVFNEPESPIVCFQFKPKNLSLEQVNSLNQKIRNKIFQEGEMIFNYAKIKDKTVLRCVISNPELTEKMIEQIIENIEEKGKYFLNS